MMFQWLLVLQNPGRWEYYFHQEKINRVERELNWRWVLIFEVAAGFVSLFGLGCYRN
jgi:hypothetical protein